MFTQKKIEWKKLKVNWKVNALKENDYTDSFINSTLQPKRQTSSECAWPQSFVVISYIQGVSETIGTTLSKHGMKITYKHTITIGSILKKPKDKADKKSDWLQLFSIKSMAKMVSKYTSTKQVTLWRPGSKNIN